MALDEPQFAFEPKASPSTKRKTRRRNMVAPSNDSRRFDLVVLGATGFVGRLVAEEIATNYQVGL